MSECRLNSGHMEHPRIPEIWIHAALASLLAPHALVEIVGLERLWLGWRPGPRASLLGYTDFDV